MSRKLNLTALGQVREGLVNDKMDFQGSVWAFVHDKTGLGQV